MPGRIIDSDSIARNAKLARCSPSARAWYGYFLAFALANGSFEAAPASIAAHYFALIAPQITADEVAALLGDYERNGLLFLFEDSRGRAWGYFTTADDLKLPSPKDVKARRLKKGEPVPARALAQYLKRPYEETLKALIDRHSEPEEEPRLPFHGVSVAKPRTTDPYRLELEALRDKKTNKKRGQVRDRSGAAAGPQRSPNLSSNQKRDVGFISGAPRRAAEAEQVVSSPPGPSECAPSSPASLASLAPSAAGGAPPQAQEGAAPTENCARDSLFFSSDQESAENDAVTQSEESALLDEFPGFPTREMFRFFLADGTARYAKLPPEGRPTRLEFLRDWFGKVARSARRPDSRSESEGT
jgi:hypothetical protein